ncbi:MAG: DEAD/DEAH box helicase, partial [Firmicutes bacterium]|nr:DEAD/DEAH box helicase [Bacillota bacterium]
RAVKEWPAVLPWREDTGGERPEGAARLRRELTEEEALAFLTDGSLRLAEAGQTVLLPAWWDEVRKHTPALKIRTRSSVGAWQESRLGLSRIVEFDWSLAVGDLELPEEAFREMVEKKRRLIRVQGRWVRLDPAVIRQIQRFARKKDGLSLGEILHLRLLPPAPPPPAEQEAGAEEALRVEVELGGQIAQMVDQLNNLSAIPVLETAPSFRGALRKYQQAGTSWLLFLRRFGLGGCLADDMGLGKTIQWIAYLLQVKESENPPFPSLLICPTSVLGNWQKELARFAPALKTLLHYGPQRAKGPAFLPAAREADLVITSYNLAHLDEEELAAVEWDCICLDEAQNIKNAYTKQAAAVRKFKGRHRIAMTGTPMENRLTELWSIFDFINPGYLGSSGEFSRKFVGVIEKKGDAEDIGRVQKLIRPFLLRRLKSDPAIELDLPEKQEQKEYIPLTVEQASLYESILHDLFEKLENAKGMARRGLVLSTLTRLKQVCAHPALLLKDEPPGKISGRSRKVERLLELVAELRRKGDRCLIFTQFIRMGQLLQELLEQELGERSFYLHGGTPKRVRDEMTARFQGQASENGDDCGIFILSLKAGGLGLNLTAASHVFHFDRWWNPAVENQATDRSHRIGQSRHVMVHKFISLGTVEERIDEVLERKAGLSGQIVDGGEGWITEIPTAELKELFSLRREWVGA